MSFLEKQELTNVLSKICKDTNIPNVSSMEYLRNNDFGDEIIRIRNGNQSYDLRITNDSILGMLYDISRKITNQQ